MAAGDGKQPTFRTAHGAPPYSVCLASWGSGGPRLRRRAQAPPPTHTWRTVPELTLEWCRSFAAPLTPRAGSGEGGPAGRNRLAPGGAVLVGDGQRDGAVLSNSREQGLGAFVNDDEGNRRRLKSN